jgi:cell fate regulator YaaT (PSP1 superfamily)
VLRAMTTGDENELSHMRQQERREFEVCRKAISELNMDMKLIDIEHVFGGERVVIYYLSENRVDFRDLVKRLADEFQTRIEMRQIGIRDEAKLLADYGDCGKPVCCNTHLVQMPPVSMRMAKLQKATLDPNKISGRCGRLKCCLRYEYDVYEQMQKKLPPLGSRVSTPEGPGRVISQEIIAEKLVVQTDDRRRLLVDVADASPLAEEEKPPQDKSDKQDAKPDKPQSGKPENRRDSGRGKGPKG